MTIHFFLVPAEYDKTAMPLVFFAPSNEYLYNGTSNHQSNRRKDPGSICRGNKEEQ